MTFEGPFQPELFYGSFAFFSVVSGLHLFLHGDILLALKNSPTRGQFQARLIEWSCTNHIEHSIFMQGGKLLKYVARFFNPLNFSWPPVIIQPQMIQLLIAGFALWGDELGIFYLSLNALASDPAAHRGKVIHCGLFSCLKLFTFHMSSIFAIDVESTLPVFTFLLFISKLLLHFLNLFARWAITEG